MCAVSVFIIGKSPVQSARVGCAFTHMLNLHHNCECTLSNGARLLLLLFCERELLTAVVCVIVTITQTLEPGGVRRRRRSGSWLIYYSLFIFHSFVHSYFSESADEDDVKRRASK